MEVLNFFYWSRTQSVLWAPHHQAKTRKVRNSFIVDTRVSSLLDGTASLSMCKFASGPQSVHDSFSQSSLSRLAASNAFQAIDETGGRFFVTLPPFLAFCLTLSMLSLLIGGDFCFNLHHHVLFSIDLQAASLHTFLTTQLIFINWSRYCRGKHYFSVRNWRSTSHNRYVNTFFVRNRNFLRRI